MTRNQAYAKLHYALFTGKVVKPLTCESCGKQPKPHALHAHHPCGYDEPLNVQWLCVACHERVHDNISHEMHVRAGKLGGVPKGTVPWNKGMRRA